MSISNALTARSSFGCRKEKERLLSHAATAAQCSKKKAEQFQTAVEYSAAVFVCLPVGWTNLRACARINATSFHISSKRRANVARVRSVECLPFSKQENGGFFMRKSTTHDLTLAALVAALYAVMGYFGNVFGLTFGGIQCRFSDALCVLPFLYPCTVPGLLIGCLITNLMSTVGPLDILFGSLSTLLAAIWTSKMPNRYLAPLPPVLCNGVMIGAMIAWYEAGFGPGFWPLFTMNAIGVAIGEAIACYGLGSFLLSALEQIPQLTRDRR